MKIKRKKVEDNYSTNSILRYTEVTFVYEDEKEYHQHLADMRANGYVLEKYNRLNVSGPDEECLCPCAQYSKRERIKNQ